MGLAASQARLLTITSRLSNTELRQQQIANTKMRLSADQEQVSTKYSNALNNQTLTLNDAPMTYYDLVAAGYSVVRTSDGVSTQATTRTIERTTKNESLKPSMTVEAKKAQEPQKPTVTRPASQPTAPVQPTTVDFAPVFSELSKLNEKAREYNTKGGAIDSFRWSMGSQITSLKTIATKVAAVTTSAVERVSTLQDSWSKNITYTGKTNPWLTNFPQYMNDYNSAYSACMSAQSSYNAQVNNQNSSMWKQYNSQKSSYDTQNDAWTAWNNYDANHKTWENEVAQLENAWAAYNNSSVTVTETEEVEAKNDLAEALKSNSDFLIQGILSGYLTLMKDGQQVSLAGSKEISTVYDKSDDAQAEAEYNAAMAKINRKEKALDNEMKRLDTEHSALQTELESIKSIISNHASKDFNLFS